MTAPIPSARYMALLEQAHASEDPADMAVLLDCAMAEGLTLTLPRVQAYPSARPSPAITITPDQVAAWGAPRP